jgi:hypothetical protein
MTSYAQFIFHFKFFFKSGKSFAQFFFKFFSKNILFIFIFWHQKKTKRASLKMSKMQQSNDNCKLEYIWNLNYQHPKNAHLFLFAKHGMYG